MGTSHREPREASLEAPAHLLHLWAKWPRTAAERRYHPVICHLVDVASVAYLMWTRTLTSRQRARVAAELACSERDARRWVAFWAGLHDLGKASPAFQTQLKPYQGSAIVESWLREAGLSYRGATWQPHGAVSVVLLEEILSQRYGMPEQLTRRVAALVGAHHGLFFSASQLRDLADPQWIGDQAWADVQERLAQLLAAALALPSTPPSGQISPSAGMLLAGFISVADWVGSNTDHFPLAVEIDGAAISPSSLDLRAYTRSSLRHASEALDDVAWDSADLSGRAQPFTALFPVERLRPVQQQVVALADQLTGPGLVLIEVPMGEGKTEAAMYLADAWSARWGMRGAYFALPTQGTSNQMFGRVQRYLERRFSALSDTQRDTQRDAQQFVNLHLAHGMAALSEPYDVLRRRARVAHAMLYDEQHSEASGSPAPDALVNGELGAVIAANWFTSPKRALLASYGVGTIDQSLLAVLQIKHVFIRLFGLSAKTVILDEVHAYDTYMSTLLERLLRWLGALGAPVVLLSATLPVARRQALVAAYAQGTGWPTPAIEQRPYPRITYLLGQQCAQSIHVDVDAAVRTHAPVHLRWINAALPQASDQAFPLAEALREALQQGGCAAIVCNTVRRAQDLFSALQRACATWPVEERPELALFHARFPFVARMERESQTLTEYGLAAGFPSGLVSGLVSGTPAEASSRGSGEAIALSGGSEGPGERNPHRPLRKVLVATQVIEQSLDLDFDLLISDLAPVDLLLQRVGRLHRHRQNDPFRPPRLRLPELWIARPSEDVVPGEQSGTPLDPTFEGADEYIYSPHVLLRTWYALRSAEAITIPDDIERLIEAVYDEHAAPPADAGETFTKRWFATREHDQRAMQQARSRAQAAVILPPSDDHLFYDTGRNLEEDAPDIHRSLQAQTRDGDPSVQVVLLDSVAASLRRSQPPTIEEARTLLGASLSLSHRGVVNALLDDPACAPPSGWLKTPWLRHHRLIALDANHQTRLDDGRRVFTLTLDPMLGLHIESRKHTGKED